MWPHGEPGLERAHRCPAAGSGHLRPVGGGAPAASPGAAGWNGYADFQRHVFRSSYGCSCETLTSLWNSITNEFCYIHIRCPVVQVVEQPNIPGPYACAGGWVMQCVRDCLESTLARMVAQQRKGVLPKARQRPAVIGCHLALRCASNKKSQIREIPYHSSTTNFLIF